MSDTTRPLPHADTFGGSGDPHMWAVTTAVRTWWESYGRPSRICVALSGGADSLALTAGAIRTGAQVTALVVDHQLQEGSTQVAHHAADQARQLGCVDALVIPIIVTDEQGAGMEAAAREARYAALDMLRAGQPVLLGHTQDDQAETLLLGLLRGSGPRAIAGMLPWEEPWGRPLLGLRRLDTQAACAEHTIDVWEDPQNSDPAFTRVRVRHELLPLLRDISGGDVVPGLARTAQLVREDTVQLDAQAADLLDRLTAELPLSEPNSLPPAEPTSLPVSGLCDLPISGLCDLPDPTLRRVLRLWLHRNGQTQVGYPHLTSIARLLTDWHGQGPVTIPGGATVRRHHQQLTLQAPTCGEHCCGDTYPHPPAPIFR
ncbi:tRNA lysidine(34) synthetase TilS [Lawsonella clevelandensis]|nr:tRNA lysidine(34) synthetase TilS [Lawsonella clevelandensis]